jgi:hypothetical protein
VAGNHLGKNILVAQAVGKDVDSGVVGELTAIRSLPAGEYAPLHCPNTENKHPKYLVLRLDEQASWSGPFCIDNVQDFALPLRSAAGILIARVQIVEVDATLKIHIREDLQEWPPFTVRNEMGSGEKIVVQQSSGNDVGDFAIVIAQNDEKPLALTSPLLPPTLSIKSSSFDFECDINELGETPIPGTSGRPDVVVMVEARGPTRLITVAATNSNWQSERLDQKTVAHGAVKTEVKVSIEGVGLSVVGWNAPPNAPDRKLEELLFVAISDISAVLAIFSDRKEIELSVENVQADWMIDAAHGSADQILLHGLTGVKEKKKPVLHVAAIVRSDVPGTAVYVDALSILLQTLEVKLDVSYVVPCLPLLKALKRQLQAKSIYSESTEVRCATRRAAIAGFAPDQLKPQKMFYFKVFNLQPIKLVLSLHLGKLSANGLDFSLPGISLLAGLVTSFGNIDHAPIRLSSITLDHVFVATQPLVKRIIKHLVHQSVGQAYKIVGSIDMLGNPVGFVNTLSRGAIFFFYDPIQGIAQGPVGLAKGLASGTFGLLQACVEGAFHVPSHITKALASGLGGATNRLAMSGPSTHAEKGTEARNLVEGFTFAAEDFGVDLYRTVTSIFVAPVHGAMKGGAVGFLKGVGQGIGQTAVSATAIGVDLAANITAGLGKLLELPMRDREPQPLRMSRVVRHGEVLEIYDSQRVAGQKTMQRLDHLDTHERYADHYELPTGQWIVLTNIRVALLSSKVKQLWAIRLDAITGYGVDGDKLTIQFDVVLSPGNSGVQEVECCSNRTAGWTSKPEQIKDVIQMIGTDDGPTMMATWSGHLNPSVALYSAEDIENAFRGNSTGNKAKIVSEAVEAEMRSLLGKNEAALRAADEAVCRDIAREQLGEDEVDTLRAKVAADKRRLQNVNETERPALREELAKDEAALLAADTQLAEDKVVEVRDRSALENARAATEANQTRLEQAKKISAQAQVDALQCSKTTAQRDKSGKKKRRCMCCGYVDDAESVRQYAHAHRP